jgi:hypothetical protein
MIPDKENMSLIDQYVHHLLEGEELARFEKELASNEELKQKVILTQVANKVLLKNKLWEMKELTKERIELGKKEKALKWRTWLGLSVLALLGGLAYFYVTREKETPLVLPSTPKTEETAKVTEALPAPPVPAEEQKQLEIAQEKPRNNSQVPKMATSKTRSKEEVAIIQAPEKAESAPITHLPKEEPKEIKAILDPVKPEPAKAPSDACSATKIEASVNTDQACLNQSNGVIMVSHVRGGAKPYQVKILDEHQKEKMGTHLAAGMYSVLITDMKSCKTLIPHILIKEETCEKDFEINPSNGDTWDYGVSTVSSTLSVYDAGENMYFYKQFSPGEKIQWNGMSSKGEVLPGYFLFVLKYQDGKSRAGSITIQK